MGEGVNERVLLQQLPYLQDRIKRDREGYKDEFEMQHSRFLSLLKLMELKPDSQNKAFTDLAMFLSHVAPLYPSRCPEFVDKLFAFVEQHHTELERKGRSALVSALILLRNKQAIPAVKLLTLCFKLFRCADKGLRATMHHHIVADVRNVNRNGQNQGLNKALQNFLFTMIKDTNPTAATKSLDVMVELYRKGVWKDARTANVMAEACFSQHSRVRHTALAFFVGVDEEEEAGEAVNSSDEEHELTRREMYNAVHKNVSRNKKTQKKLRHAMDRLKKRKSKSGQGEPGFSALHLLHDPQTFTERLFALLRKTTDKFEMKLRLLHVISRLMGMHRLLVLGVFPFIQRYMRPSQPDITRILVYLAQSTHELIPPDVLEPVLLTLVNEFVSDRSSSEAQAAGLNTIRELCQRCPTLMNQTLLSDLVQYKRERDKGVSSAARSLLQMFRQLNPELLHKKHRGKEASTGAISAQDIAYGSLRVSKGVDGAELLQLAEAPNDGDKEWDVASLKAESEGWVSVQSDQEIDFPSSSDEEESESEEDEGEEEEGEEGEGEEGEEVEAEGGSDEEGEEKGPEGAEKVTEVVQVVDAFPSDRVDMTRILTPADFRRIEALKAAQEVDKLTGSKKRRLEMTQDAVKLGTAEDAVDERTIVGFRKKKKLNKEERLAKIMEGREGRSKYGHKAAKTGAAGLTNKEKQKKKVAPMVRRSNARKRKMKLSPKVAAKQFKGKFRK